MALFLLAFAGGLLTIVSPCILPVLPFVFARADRPFRRSTLPMLVGMTGMFTAVATLAAVGGNWAINANRFGRLGALVVLGVFGAALLFPALATWLTRPLVAWGARLSNEVDRRESIIPSMLLGVATGLLWAPCAGPILGLILTGAALDGANTHTTLLLLSFAAGAATSLALALLAGGRIFAAMKKFLGAGEWIRRGLGVAVVGGVVAIALGLDTGVLTRLSLASTSSIEQGLVDRAGDPRAKPATAMTGGSAMSGGAAMSSTSAMSGGSAMTGGSAMMSADGARGASEPLGIEGDLPSLNGATQWLNSPPLSNAALKGKVVLIDFWTYSCINCLRAIPYVRAWAEKYRSQGLVVIGIHSPEFAFEKRVDNVTKAAADLGITYPIAIDNDYTLWRAFSNQYWPAHYFADVNGKIRHHRFGEGGYDESERIIQDLLREANGRSAPDRSLVSVNATGAQAAAAEADVASPETYIGYERAERFVSPGGAVEDKTHTYASGGPRLNEWGLVGKWTIGKEHATLNSTGGSVVYTFHARDLHLVIGPGVGAKPVRFRVTIDGAPPGKHHGVDVNAAGEGTITEQRLYQLIRQTGTVEDRTFEIRFLDPGVEVFAFTFG